MANRLLARSVESGLTSATFAPHTSSKRVVTAVGVKYKVTIHEHIIHDLEVEAESEAEAKAQAETLLESDGQYITVRENCIEDESAGWVEIGDVRQVNAH
jgi:hypothetical protein